MKESTKEETRHSIQACHVVGVTDAEVTFLRQHPEQGQEWIFERKDKLILPLPWTHALHALRTPDKSMEGSFLGVSLREIVQHNPHDLYHAVVYFPCEHVQAIQRYIQELFQCGDVLSITSTDEHVAPFVRYVAHIVHERHGMIVAIG